MRSLPRFAIRAPRVAATVALLSVGGGGVALAPVAAQVAFVTDLPRTLVVLRQDPGADAAIATLRERLAESGFPLVDPAFTSTAVQRQALREALSGDESAAVALGRDFGAQLLILGEVELGTAPDPADATLSLATSEIRLRAVRMDDARTVASATGAGRSLDATREAAGSAATRAALDSILASRPFLGRIANDWASIAWRTAEYFPADPGSLLADARLDGGPSGIHVAVSSSLPLADTASTRSRGIVLSRAGSVRVAVEGLVVGPASTVQVEGVEAELQPAPIEVRGRAGVGDGVRAYRAVVDLAEDRDTVLVAARGTSGEAKVAASPWVRERWAVVIGVGRYASPDIPDLEFAAADAKAVYDLLRSPEGGGFDEGRVLLLLDGEATVEAIRQALFVFLRQAKWNDLVVVYFAGHGAPDPSRAENLYLLPADAQLASLPTTAFPMWDVKTALRRHIAAEQVIVIADACHAGGTRDGGDNRVGDAFSDLFSPSRRVTLTAARVGELSVEGPRWGGHGVFTHHLLRAFSDSTTDSNVDGALSFREVADYVTTRVRADTEGRQNPEATGLGDIVWGRATSAGASASVAPDR